MRELVREAAAAHDGAEVDWAGDGVFLAFPRARDAVAAAAADPALARRGAVAATTRRIASGSASTRASPSSATRGTSGSTSSIAARICAAAHGEQVVVSQATRDVAGDEPLPGASFRPLGRHRLKDVPSAPQLFQLVAPDLREDFPPLKTLSATSLPALHHRLVGRADALARVEALLGDAGASPRHDHRPGRRRARAGSRSRSRPGRRSSGPSTSSGSRRSRTPSSFRARSRARSACASRAGGPLLDAIADRLDGTGALLYLDNLEHLSPARRPRRRAARPRARSPGPRDEPYAAPPLDRARPAARAALDRRRDDALRRARRRPRRRPARRRARVGARDLPAARRAAARDRARRGAARRAPAGRDRPRARRGTRARDGRPGRPPRAPADAARRDRLELRAADATASASCTAPSPSSATVHRSTTHARSRRRRTRRSSPTSRRSSAGASCAASRATAPLRLSMLETVREHALEHAPRRRERSTSCASAMRERFLELALERRDRARRPRPGRSGSTGSSASSTTSTSALDWLLSSGRVEDALRAIAALERFWRGARARDRGAALARTRSRARQRDAPADVRADALWTALARRRRRATGTPQCRSLEEALRALPRDGTRPRGRVRALRARLHRAPPRRHRARGAVSARRRSRSRARSATIVRRPRRADYRSPTSLGRRASTSGARAATRRRSRSAASPRRPAPRHRFRLPPRRGGVRAPATSTARQEAFERRPRASRASSVTRCTRLQRCACSARSTLLEGDLEPRRRALRESLAIVRRARGRPSRAECLCALGGYAAADGRRRGRRPALGLRRGTPPERSARSSTRSRSIEARFGPDARRRPRREQAVADSATGRRRPAATRRGRQSCALEEISVRLVDQGGRRRQ